MEFFKLEISSSEIGKVEVKLRIFSMKINKCREQNQTEKAKM